MKYEIYFNNEELGLCSEEQIARLFNNPSKIVGVKEGLVSITKDPEDESIKVLQVKYPPNIIQEDKTRWHLKFDKVDSATLTYKVFFPPEFDFVRGGKLPGLYGGSAPRGGASTDKGDGFSARIMWRENGEIFQYVYWVQKDSNKKWGDDLPLVNLEANLEPFKFTRGEWHTLMTRIVMNTPGENDGNITTWFDGKLALSTSGIFRSKDFNFGIDTFAFTTFFGGNDESWAPKKDEVAYFKDIKIELD